MKKLHRDDLFSWSVFAEKLNVDFSGFAWIREGGNVLIDPVVMTAHDAAHLASLGGAAWIVVTNSDHLRDAVALAAKLGAKIAGPVKEKDRFPIACDRWLSDGDALVPDFVALELEGSKTPGELAMVVDRTTVICGDLVRSHRAGSLMLLLPEQKLSDRSAAMRSVRRLAALPGLDAVLVGDGFSIYRDGRRYLEELARSG